MPVKAAAALATQMAEGILNMGWAFLSVDHVSNPTLGVHPLARSRCHGLVLRIVNLNSANSGRFGTVPALDSSTDCHYTCRRSPDSVRGSTLRREPLRPIP